MQENKTASGGILCYGLFLPDPSKLHEGTISAVAGKYLTGYRASKSKQSVCPQDSP